MRNELPLDIQTNPEDKSLEVRPKLSLNLMEMWQAEPEFLPLDRSPCLFCIAHQSCFLPLTVRRCILHPPTLQAIHAGGS